LGRKVLLGDLQTKLLPAILRFRGRQCALGLFPVNLILPGIDMD